MKTAASFPATALGPGQQINWAVHAVVTEVLGLHHQCPALARAATVPAIRCHHGADAFGGIVDFSHPLPINTKHGDDGWLAIHFAACFGHVGAEYEARVAWVYEREDLWCRIARDPLSHLEWAEPDVSDPWTALAAAMVAHLDWYLGVAPSHPKRAKICASDSILAHARMTDMRLLLGHEEPRNFPSAPILAAVEVHRVAWLAYMAAPGRDVVNFDAWSPVSILADAAADAVLETPCGDRSGAKALIAHARWYAEELAKADDDRADGLDYTARRLQARQADLSLLLQD